APASASDLAMANPYPASSATPATRARFPVRSIGSIAPFSRAPPQDARESLLGSPLPDGGGRRRDVLVPGPSQPERLRRDPDELHQLGIAPALLRLVVEELDRPLAGAGAVIRALGGDGVVDVRELQDLRRDGEGRSLDAVGISRSVELLVVPADDGQQVPQRLERLADALA